MQYEIIQKTVFFEGLNEHRGTHQKRLELIDV